MRKKLTQNEPARKPLTIHQETLRNLTGGSQIGVPIPDQPGALPTSTNPATCG